MELDLFRVCYFSRAGYHSSHSPHQRLPLVNFSPTPRVGEEV
jgi:hypothetical protein